MNFDVGTLLLTLGACVALLAVYRFMDRNNRSLEKVKKYADKLKDDLGAFVEQRHITLKDYAIELDVRQKAAKEVLGRVKEIEDSLNSRAQALDAVGKRIAEYDAVLDELMGMTERADENLRRIKEESEFADTVAKKLEAADAKLSSVMKGLPAIQSEFDKTNDANFKRYTHELRVSIDKALRDSTEGAEEAAKRAQAARSDMEKADKLRGQKAQEELVSLEATFEKAFEKARREAEKLEDTAFGKLKDSIMGRASKLQEAMEEKFLSLQAMAKDRIQETQGLLKGHKAEYQNEFKTLLEQRGATIAEIDTRVDAVEIKVKDGEKNLKAALVQALERAKADILAFKASSAAEFEAAQAQVKTRAQELSASAFEGLGKIADSKRGEIMAAFSAMAQEMENSLTAAKKEADYRFQALSTVNVDIERLDAALRQSMADIRAGIERDFQAAGEAIDKRQKEQEGRLSENMGALQSAMGDLERGLNELKTKAYENVSEKLKLFEDDFFADLKKRSEESEHRLEQWQGLMETRLTGLAQSAENERALVEKDYSDSLKERAGDFQAKLQDQIGKLESRLETYEESLGQRIANAENSFENFQASVKQSVQDTRSQTQATIQAEFSRHALELAEQLKKTERELAAWKEGAGRTMSETLELAEARKASVTKELEALKSEVALLTKDLKGRGAEALESFSKNFEAYNSESQRRLREADAAAQARVQELKSAAEDIKTKVESSEARLLGKLGEDAKALQNTLDELDKREKAFAAQTKIFERADELKLRLEEEIEDLKAELAKAQTFRSEIVELESQLGKVKRLEDDISQKMTRFMAERRRIDSMEEDFRKLLGISQAVDSKLESVTASHDSLTEVEAKLRHLIDLSNEAEGKFERLEKKSNILEATTAGVDRNFQELQSIEKGLKKHGEELKEIPDRLIDIKRSVETIMENHQRIETVVTKLTNLDETLGDIEGRIQNMQKAREWLAGTETRLQELAKEAQDQVKLFGDIMKSETSSSRKQSGAPAVGTRDTVAKLARQGWTVEEIARATKLSRGEIELILEMSPKR